MKLLTKLTLLALTGFTLDIELGALNCTAQCTVKITPTEPSICNGDSITLTASSNNAAGNALTFNGTTNYATVPHSSLFNFPSGMSIEAWIYLKSKAKHNVIVSKATARSVGFYFLVDASYEGGKLIGQGPGTQIEGSVIDTGKWYHVAYTHDNIVERLYVNGVKVKEQANTQMIANTTSVLQIGQSTTIYWGSGMLFNGTMDDIRIWNTARTPTEISANMNKSLNGNETGLVAYWKLDESSGTTLSDTTGKGNTGTLTGTPVWMVPSTSPVGGASLLYTWTPSLDLNMTTGTTVIAKPTSTVTYTVTGTGGCGTGKDSVTITVNSLPTTTITGNTLLCFGDSSVLTASGGSQFVWSTKDTTDAITVKTQDFGTLPKDSVFSVKAIANGCSKIVAVNVKANPLPTIIITGITTICSGNTASLTASGGNKYLWSTTDTASVITVTPSVNKTYTVTVIDSNNCKNNADTTVIVNQSPKATIAGKTKLCIGVDSSTVLTASGGDKYEWNTGDTIAVITANTTSSKEYAVKVSNALCSDSSKVIVQVNPLPIVSAGQDIAITSGNSTTLSATGATTYVWNPATGLNASTIANPIASPTTTTSYIVTGTDSNNCSNTDSLIITVTKETSCKEFFIPTAFSPNNNKFNDILLVRGSCINNIKEANFIIYNRWGEKVFETDALTKGWDGTYNGKELNTAVFVYYLKAILNTDEVIEQKGNISLIR